MNTIGFLDKVSKWSIYLLIFLLPIFFLPWNANFLDSILDFNKQALLLVLVLVSLVSWLLKSLSEGKIRLNLSILNVPVLLYVLVMAISTGFSSWQYGSFWGWPLNIASSFLTLLGFAIFYFLITNIFSPASKAEENKLEEKKSGLFTALFLSVFLTIVLAGLQFFGQFFLPFAFAKSVSFNTIGAPSALAIFMAILLPLVLIFSFICGKILKWLFLLLAFAVLFLLLIINSWLAWLTLLIGISVILIFGITRREIFKTNWTVLALFFMIFALFFVFSKTTIPSLPTFGYEVYPTQGATLVIAWESLKESIQTIILGTGPATFSYNYSQYGNGMLNFLSGSSSVLEKIGNGGILGLLSFLLLLLSFVWFSFKKLITGKEIVKPEQWIFNLGIASSLTALVFSLFIYSANVSILFLFWFLSALSVAFSSSLEKETGWFKIKKMKEIEIVPGSLSAVFASFAFVFLLVAGLGLLFASSQRYLAEINYSQGLVAYQTGDLDKAIVKVSNAVKFTSQKQDNYLRDLSQLYLYKINEEVQAGDIAGNEQKKQEINNLTAVAVNAAKLATETAPKNAENFIVRGFVYRSLIGLVGGADEWAIENYEDALKLEPNNPFTLTELGKVYLVSEKTEEAKTNFNKAIALRGDYAPAHFQLALVSVKEGKIKEAIDKMVQIQAVAPDDIGLAFQLGVLYYNDEQFAKAQANFEKAIALNNNYSNARYFLGLTFDKQGKKSLALEQFNKIAELNPDNQELKTIIANLEAGKPAIAEAPKELPIEEGTTLKK